ncbi:MAG: roadblock/LC7 domain-containing protein [Desulfuromonadales bacterium]|jgi:predicted regulator of Ras-like GTPase activity (Roadblock/LC7/MglB family)|nr:roadblock/LC7 domain-containing protein [Desulfuromonadales bacterium]
MPFKTLLRDMIERVPGAQGAILADWEGEAVDQVGLMDDYDLKLIGAYKGVMLTNLRDVASRLNNDQLKEIIITTERAQMLVLPVTLEYFLVFTLNRSDVMGRALFEARRCIQALQKEIA